MGGRQVPPAGDDAAPGTCLPCHAGERPTIDDGWTSTTYTNSPFDYGTNAAGITHGDGQDCAALPHRRTGRTNWAGGNFAHGAGTVSAHARASPATRRSGRRRVGDAGFDHAHERHRRLLRLPPGDGHRRQLRQLQQPRRRARCPAATGKAASAIPAASLVELGDQFITVTEINADPRRADNLVTSTTTDSDDALQRHAARLGGAAGARSNAGPAGDPDNRSAGTATPTPTAPSPPYAQRQVPRRAHELPRDARRTVTADPAADAAAAPTATRRCGRPGSSSRPAPTCSRWITAPIHGGGDRSAARWCTTRRPARLLGLPPDGQRRSWSGGPLPREHRRRRCRRTAPPATTR